MRLNGCLNTLRSSVWLISISALILIISTTSLGTLFFANSFGEACGYIHPYIFEINVNIIDTRTGTVSTSSLTEIPITPLLLSENTTGSEAAELDTLLRLLGEIPSNELGVPPKQVRIGEYDVGLGEFGGAVFDFQIPDNLVDAEDVPVSSTDITDLIIIVDTGNDGERSGNFTLDIINSTARGISIPDDSVSSSRNLSFNSADYIRREWRISPNRIVRYRLPVSELTTPVDILAYGVSSTTVGEPLDASVGLSVGNLNIYQGTDIADVWASCIEHYGYFSDSGFVINANAFREFLPPARPFRNRIIERCVEGAADGSVDTTRFSNSELLQAIGSGCEISANVELSTRGRLNLYFLLPMLVIVLPIVVAGVIARRRGWLWFVFMLFVAVQANAAALMLVHFAQVSQIESLGEFGYGIFGGVITGAALAFLDQLMNRIAEPKANDG